ncbi:hypothetical protein [Aureispira anguillae]|uniref:Uncharacterized protein n=1 Tax=Aureispira anguillae TaxID=2864201 RepID=A0A916DVA3_9BACT|nr:hypothetical protein [Aureispira anguillae]BDS12941.1 hypothetical protein AsAng_0036660 [Aureispira anguillae]
MNENINFWSSLWKYGRRAIGAVVREFSTNSDLTSEPSNRIGPIELIYKDGKTYGNNTSASSVALSCTSVNNVGRAQEAKDVFFKPAEEIDLTEPLRKNLAGTVSWRIFDDQGQFSSENSFDSGGLITSLNNWASGPLSLGGRDLNMIINQRENHFNIQALSHDYTNVTIDVMTQDGSFYTFGPFNIQRDGSRILPFPNKMDEELPISSITFRANCNEEHYQALLKGA